MGPRTSNEYSDGLQATKREICLGSELLIADPKTGELTRADTQVWSEAQ